MFKYNEELRELHRKVTRKNDVETELSDLREKRKNLSPQVEKLKRTAKREQKDVDRLEGTSIAALFYQATGKLDEKLETERREAETVQAKYESAAREMESLDARILKLESEQAEMDGCEVRYAQLVREKLEAIKAAGGANAEKIKGKERTLTFLDSQQRQLKEAIAAGKIAFRAADNLVSCLDSTSYWGARDMMGGSLMADMTKREKLDEARAAAKHLQKNLELFKGKLFYVSIRSNLQFAVESMLRWTNGFVETSFTELRALDRISRAREETVKIQNQIRELLNQLDQALKDAMQKEDKTKASLEKMIVSMD